MVSAHRASRPIRQLTYARGIVDKGLFVRHFRTQRRTCRREDGGYRYNGMSRLATYNVVNTVEYKWLIADKLYPACGNCTIGVKSNSGSFYMQRLWKRRRSPPAAQLVAGDKPDLGIPGSPPKPLVQLVFRAAGYNYDSRYFASANYSQRRLLSASVKDRNALFTVGRGRCGRVMSRS